MNERIKQLAAKANFGHMENGEVVYDPRLEKFAELIIRECADIATMNQFQWDSAGGYMLKHFGVKE
jgi:hypothetical protein